MVLIFIYFACVFCISLVPRPLREKGSGESGLLSWFGRLSGQVPPLQYWNKLWTWLVSNAAWVRADDSNLYILQVMAQCIPAVGEPYDCAKAAITLEHSNSFPWPKDCIQIHQTPFPLQRVGSGHETSSACENKSTKIRTIDFCINFDFSTHSNY